ncbi:glycosyltransferase family 2 protein [Arcanobacterium haemolyticum]|nr:glycosyltransferase family 2 protein [Arcanobacterium haemolyticum]
MKPTLTIVVPCYNSEDYLARCVDSMLHPWADDVEIILVNDGSKDGTARIIDEYAAAHPGKIVGVHKENGGHGSGINAGLARATGAYFKVVDSDDWVDAPALKAVLERLRWAEENSHSFDILVTNFVYEKEGKTHKRVLSYRRVLPRDRAFSWETIGRFSPWQYLLMHSIIFRTGLLRECDLHVPEHSFYVDNYFAFVPLAQARVLGYLDVDFYRYYIGRDDQSVNEKVMIGRIDQQLNINRLMVEHLSRVRGTIPAALERYMTAYATLVTLVSSVLLVREGSPESMAKKRELWKYFDELDPELYAKMIHLPTGFITSRDNPVADWTVRHGYDVARFFIGFN